MEKLYLATYDQVTLQNPRSRDYPAEKQNFLAWGSEKSLLNVLRRIPQVDLKTVPQETRRRHPQSPPSTLPLPSRRSRTDSDTF